MKHDKNKCCMGGCGNVNCSHCTSTPLPEPLSEATGDWEKKAREGFHSFWNNHLYGDGDTEPLFPSYSEIADWWMKFLRSEIARAVEEERQRIKKMAEEMKKKGNPEMETNQDYGRNDALNELIKTI